MQRSLKRAKDRDAQVMFDFIFDNAFGLPVIFNSEPTAAQMKANTWGKVKDVNTAMYVKFGDAGAIKFTGTELA